MTSTDMKHMEFIDLVAASDTAVLRRKEETYQGSWKAAGGRSAWFMARRNMDRLLVMMERPKTVDGFSIEDLDDLLSEHEKLDGIPYGDVTLDASILGFLRDCYVQENIFAKIRENPRGEDGTVLACLRDLRRYFMLIEAEMIARGVVTAEQAREVPYNQSGLDRVQEVAKKTLVTSDGLPVIEGKRYRFTDPDGYEQTVCEVFLIRDDGMVTVDFGGVYLIVSPRTLSKLEGPGEVKVIREPAETVAEAMDRQRTPEDGAQATSLAPWAVGMKWRHNNNYLGPNQERVLQFNRVYKQQAPGLWVLEPYLEPGVSPVQQAEHVYREVGSFRILRIEDCPPDARDFFPYIPREVNEVHLAELPPWQKSLYTWHGDQNKYTVTTGFEAWVRD